MSDRSGTRCNPNRVTYSNRAKSRSSLIQTLEIPLPPDRSTMRGARAASGKPPRSPHRIDRRQPVPPQIDETHDAALPVSCPACGGTVHGTSVVSLYQEDLPVVPSRHPRVTAYATRTGHGFVERPRSSALRDRHAAGEVSARGLAYGLPCCRIPDQILQCRRIRDRVPVPPGGAPFACRIWATMSK